MDELTTQKQPDYKAIASPHLAKITHLLKRSETVEARAFNALPHKYKRVVLRIAGMTPRYCQLSGGIHFEGYCQDDQLQILNALWLVVLIAQQLPVTINRTAIYNKEDHYENHSTTC